MVELVCMTAQKTLIASTTNGDLVMWIGGAEGGLDEALLPPAKEKKAGRGWFSRFSNQSQLVRLLDSDGEPNNDSGQVGASPSSPPPPSPPPPPPSPPPNPRPVDTGMISGI